MILEALRTTVTLVLGFLLMVPAANAQLRGEGALIGFMSSSTTDLSSPLLAALRRGLREVGYVEGKNLTIEYRLAKTKEDLPGLAADLVSRNVHLILAGGSEAVVAAKQATATIPIVMTNSGDPVREGFVASLAKPGSNITGLTQNSPELAGKRVELLKEVVPGMSRLGILWYPLHPNTPLTFEETRSAAELLGLQVLSFEIGERVDPVDAAASAGKSVDGIVVLRDPFTVRHRTAISEAVLASKAPAIYETADYVDSGGLMSYGPDFSDLYRRSASFVDKILRGAKPADLPVEQPTRFELVINLKTAAALGLTFPDSILVRTDKFIE